MQKAIKIAAGACATLMLMGTGAAHADDSLYAARIGAMDPPSLAHFYEFVFGMEQVLTRGSEIMLNFGDTVEEAKANKAPVLIIIRNTDDVKDPVSHLIFYIHDFPVTAASIEAAGGKMLGKPHYIKKTGDTIAMAVDPVGNRLELIEPAKTESPQT